MQLVVTAGDVWALRLLRPFTHEIGGSIDIDKDHRISKVDFKKGSACRDAAGKLIAGAICSVTHPNTPTVIHTHPVANRPSSGDLRTTVQGENNHVLVTPLGLWFYRASATLVSEWKKMSDEDKRRRKLEWRFVGHHHQRKTQSGNVAEFIDFCQHHGFSVSYIPYTETQFPQTVTLSEKNGTTQTK